MTEQQELLMLKGLISELPSAEQAAVMRAAERMRDLVLQHPEAAVTALALVALECQVDPQRFGLTQ